MVDEMEDPELALMKLHAQKQAAELARLREESAWRPIESAPVDTAVLTYGFGYEVAHFNVALDHWVANWDHRPIAPLFYRPLPSPPKDPAHDCYPD